MKSEAIRDSKYMELEKKCLEAEREIEKHNKIYCGALIEPDCLQLHAVLRLGQ